jgi:hypothetical protein
MTLTAPRPRRTGAYPALRLPNLKRRFTPPSLPQRSERRVPAGRAPARAA